MAYIYDNSNSIKIYLKNLATNVVSESLVFDGSSNYKPKNENKQIVNINQEILIDPIGMRMGIEISILNRESLNTQVDILKLFEWINYIQAGTHRVVVYPSYDGDMHIDTLDNFDCIIDGYYDIKKLHKFLKSGQQINLKFKEYIPNKLFIPKIPSIGTGGAVPFGGGGGIA